MMRVLPAKEQRIVCVSFNTTGLKKDDHILEIGAIELINGEPTDSQFHGFCRPRKKLSKDPRVRDKVDLTFEMLENEQDITDLIKKFINFSKNSPVISHSGEFEQKFINKECIKGGIPEYKKKWYSTREVFQLIVPYQNSSLDCFCITLGVSRRHRL